MIPSRLTQESSPLAGARALLVPLSFRQTLVILAAAAQAAWSSHSYASTMHTKQLRLSPSESARYAARHSFFRSRFTGRISHSGSRGIFRGTTGAEPGISPANGCQQNSSVEDVPR